MAIPNPSAAAIHMVAAKIAKNIGKRNFVRNSKSFGISRRLGVLLGKQMLIAM
jgi:hypothetical protein